MHLSRRELLISAAMVAAAQPRGSVICRLEESRIAFRGFMPKTAILAESSVGFANDDLSWLRIHGISFGPPQNVRGPAWVRYDWPIRAMIRDFGRVCPVYGGTVIARLGNMPVAARKGSLIVLGSPLGPHIYAGDRDACRLLNALGEATL